MPKRQRLERFSPFRVLDCDSLDLVSDRLLDDLVSKPLECIRSFVAFSIVTRWKPSHALYMKIIRAFTIAGVSNPACIVDRVVASMKARPERNACEVTVARLMQILHTLRTTPHPLRKLPTTVDEWKHAYLFFHQMTYSKSNRLEDLDIRSCGYNATHICGSVFSDSSTLDLCRNALKEFRRFESSEEVASCIQQNPFLLSRLGCTLILHSKPRLWTDVAGAPNPVLVELLKHDPEFLCATDAQGVPVCHAIFVSGVCCEKTFEYVTSHPTFSIHKRTFYEGNTVAHSLAKSIVCPSKALTQPYFPVLFRSKTYMANRLFEMYHPNRGLFCKLNRDNLQPWQLCGQLTCKMNECAELPTFLGQPQKSLSEAVDMMDEVGVLLRMSTV
jgi:hypothetical protein